MSHSLEHERNRLHAMVDDFIDNFSEQAENSESFAGADFLDLRIDVAGLVMVLNAETIDEEEVEAVWHYFESKRSHVKRGLIDMVMIDLRTLQMLGDGAAEEE